MCAVFYFRFGFTEGVGSCGRQVWLYTKVAVGHLVWVSRGLHQKQSVSSGLWECFDTHTAPLPKREPTVMTPLARFRPLLHMTGNVGGLFHIDFDPKVPIEMPTKLPTGTGHTSTFTTL